MTTGAEHMATPPEERPPPPAPSRPSPPARPPAPEPPLPEPPAPEPPALATEGEPGAAENESAYTSGLRRFGDVLRSVVAPTALASALLYYFGWNDVNWFFQYFGVNANALNFTTVDYLIYSVDALYVPLTVSALVGLVAVWAHLLLRGRVAVRFGPRVPAVLLGSVAIIGLVLGAVGALSLVVRTPLSAHLDAAPLSLAGGVVLVAYAGYQWGGPVAGRAGAFQEAAVQWTIVYTLVAVSLFWAATDYSAAVGTWRAHRLVDRLATYPDVVVYSQHGLSMSAQNVRETRCKGPESAFRYRYDGLKLVIRSGDQYFLLPAAWRPDSGTAFLIPRDSSLRLEFRRAAARPVPPPAC
ncbi:hypothetical protein [Actinomadura nitritigenes]|uniref:hypothetical protein n=1 Tax=Actinomadura nitritigenes TaxID=134602 RepID=UPI003D8A59C6